ncbi:hypothetical protein DBT_2266 [Dissulfuribacter thermophilus]|uniref:Uncharacterized protein n=1 Tax=Dissulfuribacter thermophilus TaxID=1156395 RepID=A0A1B9F3F4_9BACT|nr:hypothetical protein DBT_2266 [Dissulfuribacter thermophilus]
MLGLNRFILQDKRKLPPSGFFLLQGARYRKDPPNASHYFPVTRFFEGNRFPERNQAENLYFFDILEDFKYYLTSG